MKLGLFLLSFFLFLNHSYAATVDAGEDQNITAGDAVTLNGAISGIYNCDNIYYNWTITNPTSSDLFIENSYSLTGAYINGDNTSSFTGTYTIQIQVQGVNDGYYGEYGGSSTTPCEPFSDTMILTISPPSLNQDPTDITITSDNIDEGNNSGDSVGNFSTIDPDDPSQTDNYKYYLVSGTGADDNADFHIEDRTLHIDTQTDYETKSSYKIRVQTQDSSYASYEEEFIITINDVDETVPSVNAGENQNVTIGDTVTLNGTKSGFPTSGCDFNYKWTSDNENIIINNSGVLTGASFETNSLTGEIITNINLELIATSSDMRFDSCGKTGTYNDTAVINISEHRSSGTSLYMIRKQEAERLFKDEESIKKIKLILKEKKGSRYIYNIGWNYIGGGGHIEYEILYSTGSTFENYKEYTSKIISKSFYYNELNKDKDIYFFKVRAKYNDKESPRSNTLSITNKENILKYFKVTCKDCNKKVSYGDVLKTTDLLIEENFRVKCVNCNKKVSYKDIFKSTSYILDDFNIGCSSCNKKIEYGDIFKQSYFDIQCKNCNIKKPQVNFYELVE